MEKVVHKILFAIVCLASLLSFIEAQIFSSSQGNCLKNGTILWNGEGTPSPYHDASYSCRSNYGRPFGIILYFLLKHCIFLYLFYLT